MLTSANQDDLELKAKSLCQLAQLIADSPAHDYKLALDQHLAAIKAADQLAHDKRATVRRAAKLVLIDAHLGAANDIACGVYGQKPQIVPKWIDRATAFAEDLINNESADPALRLRVGAGAGRLRRRRGQNRSAPLDSPGAAARQAVDRRGQRSLAKTPPRMGIGPGAFRRPDCRPTPRPRSARAG